MLSLLTKISQYSSFNKSICLQFQNVVSILIMCTMIDLLQLAYGCLNKDQGLVAVTAFFVFIDFSIFYMMK